MESSEARFDRDQEHLKLLSIFHYVVGGLTIAWSSIFILHTIGMVAMYFNPDFLPKQPDGPEFPREMFLVGAIFTGSLVLMGWIFGILTIVSGRMIARRKRRLLSVVVAAVNCAAFPFGTILGVCTLLVLSRGSVRQLYEAQRDTGDPGESPNQAYH